MASQDFVLKGKHLLHSECGDKEKVLHPRTCTRQVLLEHDDSDATNLFSWITKPLVDTDGDYEVCTSLIEWLNIYYPLTGDNVLPVMTETRRGGAKVGNYLTVNATTEKLSVDLTTLAPALWEILPIATYSSLGGIIVDENNFEISNTGKLSLLASTINTVGGIKLGSSKAISSLVNIADGAHYTAFPVGKTADGKTGAMVPNSYLASAATWYLDCYRNEAYRRVTSPTDSQGNPNGINTGAQVNYILLGNDNEFGTLEQPTMALVAGEGIAFEYNINQGASSFVPVLSFLNPISEIKIKTHFPLASSSVIGGFKTLSDDLIAEDSSAWNDIPESDYGVYRVQLHANGIAGVKIPNASYTLPKATSEELGGIKVGYTSSGNNHAVQVDSNGNAYVTVEASGGTVITGTDLTVTDTQNGYNIALGIMGKDILGGGKLLHDPETSPLTDKEIAEMTAGDVWCAVRDVTKASSNASGYLAVKVPQYLDVRNKFTFVYDNGMTHYNGAVVSDESTVLTNFENALYSCVNQNKKAFVSINGGGKLDFIQDLVDILVRLGRQLPIEVSLVWSLEGVSDILQIKGISSVPLEKTSVYCDASFPGRLTKSGNTTNMQFYFTTVSFSYTYKLSFIPHSLGQADNSTVGKNSLYINTYKTYEAFA